MSDRTAEEWGRIAVSLPGWRWMEGMLAPCGGYGRLDEDDVGSNPTYRLDFAKGNPWPDPNDPATGGCLLALLGDRCLIRLMPREGRALYEVVIPSGMTQDGRPTRVNGSTLGRACIAAAAALGRWPGGEG